MLAKAVRLLVLCLINAEAAAKSSNGSVFGGKIAAQSGTHPSLTARLAINVLRTLGAFASMPF